MVLISLPNFGIRIVQAMSSEAFHLLGALVHFGKIVLNNLFNIIYGH